MIFFSFGSFVLEKQLRVLKARDVLAISTPASYTLFIYRLVNIPFSQESHAEIVPTLAEGVGSADARQVQRVNA